MPFFVNADDFGRNSETNRAICEAFEKGYTDHTTVMVNMEAAAQAFELSEKNGFRDRVGLHLNLTEGFPLSREIRGNPLICSADGRFNAAFYHNTKYRLYMDSLSISQIEGEFRAQLKRFSELGFSELHIDSHHHVHTNYPVFLALKRLCGEFGFTYIRLSRNLYRGGSILNRIYKGLYNRGVKKLCPHRVGYFGSFKDLMEFTGNDPARLERLGMSENIEIMSHPLYSGGELTDSELPMTAYEALGQLHGIM